MKLYTYSVVETVKRVAYYTVEADEFCNDIARMKAAEGHYVDREVQTEGTVVDVEVGGLAAGIETVWYFIGKGTDPLFPGIIGGPYESRPVPVEGDHVWKLVNGKYILDEGD